MAITYWIAHYPDLAVDVTLTNRIRLGAIEGFAEGAENGGAASSSVTFDDPDGNLEVKGHHLLFVKDSEPAADNQIVYVGLLQVRVYLRGDSLVQEGARQIAANLVDLNALLTLKTITGTDGKRPREKASERIAWWLASDYSSGIADFGLVVYPSHYVDAVDFRGQNGQSVLENCELPVGWNHFVYWSETDDAPGLFFDNSDRSTAWASDLQLSNDLADVDSNLQGVGATGTFAIARGHALTRDPSRVYSRAYRPFGRGSVVVEEPTIADDFIDRDGSAPDANDKTAAQARKTARQFLRRNAAEQDRFECEVLVPRENVNDIRAGHLISAKAVDLGPEGYDDFTWWRVAKRTPKQPAKTDAFWRLGLTLVPVNPFTCATSTELLEDHATVTAFVTPEEGVPTWAHGSISGWFGGPVDTAVDTIPVYDAASANDGDVATYSYVGQQSLRGPGTVAVYWEAELDDTYLLCSTKGTVEVGSNSWRSRPPDEIRYFDPDVAEWQVAPGSISYGPPLPSPEYWTYTFTTEIQATGLQLIYRQTGVPGILGLWGWMPLGLRLYDWQALGQ